MALPRLDYRQTTQNQRVNGYEVPNEDSPWIYRLEDCADNADLEALIHAAYRQVFSEHVMLKSSRLPELESQLKNRAITVRDFIRGLAKSDVFHRLVVETNSNYRVVEVALKRILGRAPYNEEEKIAWSIAIATQGVDGFVDAILNSDEYLNHFGENTVPYQRRRYNERPFNLVTPRYGNYWRDKLEEQRYKWGDIRNFIDMAREVTVKQVQHRPVRTQNISIPDTSRSEKPEGVLASISPSASFPLS
jgi:phycobilisome rod-core linker protein